jgi:NADP-dependent 3-hydroxy acid dehydrogenase YdfG
MQLQNKIAVVTGASDGIGKQVALKLAEKGVKLALIARNKTNLESVKKETVKLGSPKVGVYPCDIKNTKELENIVNKIIADFKKVDILLNIAGIWQKINPIEKINPQEVDDVIQTNLIGLIHCTQLLMPYLKKQKEAIIVNVSSVSGVEAKVGQSVYGASKYGVKGFTDVLKVDLKGSNVRVGGIYQAGTNTQMFNKGGDNFPIEKFTNPADLADVIVFMLSRPAKIWLHEIRVEY